MNYILSQDAYQQLLEIAETLNNAPLKAVLQTLPAQSAPTGKVEPPNLYDEIRAMRKEFAEQYPNLPEAADLIREDRER